MITQKLVTDGGYLRHGTKHPNNGKITLGVRGIARDRIAASLACFLAIAWNQITHIDLSSGMTRNTLRWNCNRRLVVSGTRTSSINYE